MVVETRLLRSDTHTVNGLTARKLGVDYTGSTGTETYRTAVATASADWGVRFFVCHIDGTETEVISAGTPIVIATRTAVGQGLQSATVNVSTVSLASTDAIVTRVYYRSPAGSDVWSQLGWTDPNWVTEVLNAQSLDAAVWTVYLYTLILRSETPRRYDIGLAFGDATSNSRIEGFAWTPAAPPAVRRMIGDGLTWVVV